MPEASVRRGCTGDPEPKPLVTQSPSLTRLGFRCGVRGGAPRVAVNPMQTCVALPRNCRAEQDWHPARNERSVTSTGSPEPRERARLTCDPYEGAWQGRRQRVVRGSISGRTSTSSKVTSPSWQKKNSLSPWA